MGLFLSLVLYLFRAFKHAGEYFKTKYKVPDLHQEPGKCFLKFFLKHPDLLYLMFLFIEETYFYMLLGGNITLDSSQHKKKSEKRKQEY